MNAANPAGLAVPLETIDDCFQGMIPSPICTCDLDGRPNITYLSIVHRLDAAHVALSGQFFNKTTQNLARNPRAQILVVNAFNGNQYKLDVIHARTETEGELFDRLRIRLDAVASQTGTEGVFKLETVEVFRVLECEQVPQESEVALPPDSTAGIDALEELSRRMSCANDIDDLISTALEAFAELFGYDHSILLMVNETGDQLFTVASHGFETSGAGSEVGFGEGIIGVAAANRKPVRIANLARDMKVTSAIRVSTLASGNEPDLGREIPLPGLENALSELAVPVIARDQLLGVICLQSALPGRFRAADERLVSVAAHQLGLGISLLRLNPLVDPPIRAQTLKDVSTTARATARYYPEDDSVFIDNQYLIKGVAGKVLWRLLRSYVTEQRTDFSNKELRRDAWLDLPYMRDNLETRLVLLRQRLEDRCDFLKIAQAGRGQIRLIVQREIQLEEAGAKVG